MMLLSGMAARPAFQLRFFVWRLKIVHRTRAMPASTSQRRTKPKVRRNSDVIHAAHEQVHAIGILIALCTHESMFSYSSKLVTQGSMTTSAHHTATSWICQLFVGCVAKHMPSEPSHNTLLATPVMFDRRASTSSHRSSGTLRTRFRYPLFFAHISLRLSRGRATGSTHPVMRMSQSYTMRRC